MENPSRLQFWRSLLSNRDQSKEHIGSCTWSLCYSDPPKKPLSWRTSPTIRIKGVPDYSFNILAAVDVSSNLSLLIRKNHLTKQDHLKPCAARIKINIPNYFCQSIKVSEWTDACCLLKDIVSLSTMPFCKNCSDTRFVRIECDISWFGVSYESQALPSTIRNMENWFMNSEFSDVGLVVNGERIPGHKVVLASQSKVLLGMLESGDREMEDCVVLHDVDSDAVKIALRYLYSGESRDLDDLESLKNVLVVAEKYGIGRLSCFCEHKLKGMLSVDNVVGIMGLAKELKVMSLVDFCLRFMATCEDRIVQRNDFKQLCLKSPDVSVGLIGLRKCR